MKNVYTMVVLATITLWFISACDDDNNPMNNTPLEKWQSMNVDDYEVEQRVNCNCLPPAGLFHKITVQEGEIVTVEDIRDGRVLLDEESKQFRTIDELFEFVDRIDPDSVAVYDVQFDQNGGFPTFIYIDFDAQVADEEIGYELRSFRKL